MFKVFKLNRLILFFTLLCMLFTIIAIPSSVYEAIFATSYTAKVSDFSDSTTADADAGIDKKTELIPIVMYHSIMKCRSSSYIVTPEQFEKDMTYLRDNGFNTVVMRDLINFVNGIQTLPPKPIVVTFDDGHYNNVYYCENILEKYRMRAVLSIVGEFSEASEQTGDINPSYSYLTWQQIKNISNCFELQNHSYAMHRISSKRRGALKKRSESLSEYEEALKTDLNKVQDKIHECTGRYPDTFTYPFGAVSHQSIDIIKSMGFSATLGCGEGINKIVQGDKNCLFLLKRYLRKNSPSSEKFFSKFAKLN